MNRTLRVGQVGYKFVGLPSAIIPSLRSTGLSGTGSKNSESITLGQTGDRDSIGKIFHTLIASISTISATAKRQFKRWRTRRLIAELHGIQRAGFCGDDVSALLRKLNTDLAL